MDEAGIVGVDAISLVKMILKSDTMRKRRAPTVRWSPICLCPVNGKTAKDSIRQKDSKIKNITGVIFFCLLFSKRQWIDVFKKFRCLSLPGGIRNDSKPWVILG